MHQPKRGPDKIEASRAGGPVSQGPQVWKAVTLGSLFTGPPRPSGPARAQELPVHLGKRRFSFGCRSLLSQDVFRERPVLVHHTVHSGLRRVRFHSGNLTFVSAAPHAWAERMPSFSIPTCRGLPALDALALPSATVSRQISESSLSVQMGWFLTLRRIFSTWGALGPALPPWPVSSLGSLKDEEGDV